MDIIGSVKTNFDRAKFALTLPAEAETMELPPVGCTTRRIPYC
jgi:hypothetical protein